MLVNVHTQHVNVLITSCWCHWISKCVWRRVYKHR